MRSMTGYGSATRETPLGRLTLEMRAVNNRFLELNFRLGAAFLHLEPELRNRLRETLSRGKVDISLRFDASEEFAAGARVNKAVVKRLMEDLRSIAGEHREIRPEALLAVPGAMVTDGDDEKTRSLEAIVRQLADEAAGNLIAQREREGETQRASFLEQARRMAELNARIAASGTEVVAKYRERLFARIEELMGPKSAALDPGRLEQEVAIFADKADIAEENGRLAAHLDALDALVRKNGEAVGRKLEFLSQEMLREINTIGSKSRDLDIARWVLDLKNEVESLRENIANVE